MHNQSNDQCPLNDPETFLNPATAGLPCTCKQPETFAATTPEEIIRQFSMERASVSYTDCLFVDRLRQNDFSSVEIAKIIETLESVCFHCFNNNSGCRCWDDS